MENGKDPHPDLTRPDAPEEVSHPPRSRRSFLGTLAAAAAALTAAVLGFTPKAAAEVRVACCNLCRSPSSSCSNVNGLWSWSCCLTQSGTRYSCVEYYRPDPNWEEYERQQRCTWIYGCSLYYRIGTC